VRIARVKVGNRQAPYINQDPALKSGVLAFGAQVFNVARPARDSSRNGRLHDSFNAAKRFETEVEVRLAQND
jgi:hypothetical protein